MKKLAAVCITVLIFGCYALSQDDASAPKRAPLLLVQEIPLPQVEGRIDHFTFDAKRKRVIGAALGNNTVEIVDTLPAATYTASRVRRTPRVWLMSANSISFSSPTARMANSGS